MLSKEDKEEVDKIKGKLLLQEKVEAVAKQSIYTRNAPIIPSIIFATTHRVIEKKCYPIKPKLFIYEYDKIISAELKKSIIKSTIILILPGKTLYFDALDKDKALYMLNVLNNYIKKFVLKKEKQKLVDTFKNKIRRNYSEETKEKVLERQKYRCAECNKLLTTVEFDHIYGDQSDNSHMNCQALCPNCHAYKNLIDINEIY